MGLSIVGGDVRIEVKLAIRCHDRWRFSPFQLSSEATCTSPFEKTVSFFLSFRTM
jgi:hypothetical protein